MDTYRKMENLKLVSELSNIIKYDDTGLYINPYLSNKEHTYNIIKKYQDSKINIINNNENKTVYDIPVSSSNNNMNHNNLLHFINFLI